MITFWLTSLVENPIINSDYKKSCCYLNPTHFMYFYKFNKIYMSEANFLHMATIDKKSFIYHAGFYYIKESSFKNIKILKTFAINKNV